MQPTNMADPTMTISNFPVFIFSVFIALIPFGPHAPRNQKRSQSPGAGEGAAGNMPDAGSFAAPVHFSTMKKIAWYEKDSNRSWPRAFRR